MVTHLNTQNFNEFIKEGTVLVDFFATWCGPCKLMAPVIEELATQMPNVKFAKIDVEESNEVAETYQVSSIPTFILFKNGQKVNELVGAVSKDSLKNAIMGA